MFYKHICLVFLSTSLRISAFSLCYDLCSGGMLCILTGRHPCMELKDDVCSIGFSDRQKTRKLTASKGPGGHVFLILTLYPKNL